nr:alpha-galactosidase [Streptomyces sp. NBC_00830]
MTSHAVTTAERPPAPTTPLLDQVQVSVLVDGIPVPAPRSRRLPDGLLALDMAAPPGAAVEIRLSVPLRDAVGYWHPDCGWERSLPPDWSGRLTSSLISGATVGCLYETSGATLLAFAAEDPRTSIRSVFGISEQAKRFVVHLELTAADTPFTLVLAGRSPSAAAALRRLRGHLTRTAPVAPLPLPDAGRTPAYSTWYALGQDVSATAVEREARLAAELGCGLLILDDGWQRGGRERGYAWAGNWQVDLAKFPDLAGHVAAVHDLGMAYIAWVAPLLLGPDSPLWPQLSQYARAASPTAPGAHVLDPREPAVRAHVVAVCTRLVGEHGMDGLKLDFLDDAMVYTATAAGCEVASAMTGLLTEVRDALSALVPSGPLIELRQPYLGPGMTAYGNLLRATDCPADATANRIRTLDASLIATGGAVHSDMLMWDPDAAPEWAARQILSVLHAVPQLSCTLGDLTEGQRDAVAFWLPQWERLRGVLLDGEVEPGRPDELYPVVRAHRGDAQVVVVHSDRAVPLDLLTYARTDLVNATSAGRLVAVVEHGPVTVLMTAYDARGRVTGSWQRTPATGPVALDVPPSGLLTIRRAASL